MFFSNRGWVGVALGSVMLGSAMGAPAAASSWPQSPPCTTKAVKAPLAPFIDFLLKQDGPGSKARVTKVCAGQWAGGRITTFRGGRTIGYTRYLLEAKGGTWKQVRYGKQRALCNQGVLPANVSAKACP